MNVADEARQQKYVQNPKYSTVSKGRHAPVLRENEQYEKYHVGPEHNQKDTRNMNMKSSNSFMPQTREQNS